MKNNISKCRFGVSQYLQQDVKQYDSLRDIFFDIPLVFHNLRYLFVKSVPLRPDSRGESSKRIESCSVALGYILLVYG